MWEAFAREKQLKSDNIYDILIKEKERGGNKRNEN